MGKRRGEYKLGGDVKVDARLSDLGPRKVIEGVGYGAEVFAQNRAVIMQPAKQNEIYGLPLEWQEQAELIKWCRGHEDEYPDLHWIHHSPNGEKRDDWTGKKLKLMGTSSGFPDLILPVGRGSKMGLFIEMKRIGEETRESQDEWLAYLTCAGYATAVCKGWVEGREVLIEYMRLPRTVVVDSYFLEGGQE